ncbi:MAG: chloride channel protein [Burkholderiaceae bacterium]|nr:chloride channel protein [Burkholderiaceae bacterium]
MTASLAQPHIIHTARRSRRALGWLLDPLSNLPNLWHRGSAWLIGPLLIGLVAVGLAKGADYANQLNSQLCRLYPLAPLLFMPAGFALLVYVGRQFFPGAQGSGIPQTIAAINAPGKEKSGHLLSIRIAIGKAALTLAGLLVGASIGREGPTVQIGASIMHAFQGRGPFKRESTRRILILAGGAAGIAAAFNTPLAGIMFAIEELSKKHIFNANSSTLVTVIVSGLISLALLGNYTYFGTSNTSLEWQYSLMPIVVCGVAGGLCGGLFSRLLITIPGKLPVRLTAWIARRPLAFAALCGFAVALLGYATDGLVFGTGYEATRRTLEDSILLPWYFSAAKLAATLLSSVSGMAGGIFAPSLAVGAGVGENIALLFPQLAPHSAIILLVMAAYLSGVTRAPATSFIIMMEMTGSHDMLLPLMTASVIASASSKLVCRTQLYHELADRFPLRAPAVPGDSKGGGAID